MPHRRPASWRSRGRPCSLADARITRASVGAAPPCPIAVRRAGARAAGRARSLTLASHVLPERVVGSIRLAGGPEVSDALERRGELVVVHPDRLDPQAH